MSYNYSTLDKSLADWFQNDPSASSLTHVAVRKGTIRGAGAIELPIRYPITAIAGKNGTGKSTLLALAACAYHNTTLKFNPLKRPRSHYTFADFFIRVPGESGVEGVEIWYQFLHHNWKRQAGVAPAPLAWQVRKKEAGGRWTNYDTRVPRSVAFLGIQRVVPEAEESVLRTYRAKFSQADRQTWEASVAQSVGSVLGRPYSGLRFLKHEAHRLPVLETPTYQYSGFNMGAGESALIELFATIYACNEPLMVVIDEIELGLHEEAQIGLVNELKRLAKERKLQVLCSTHSGVVLSALPPEARILLERTSTRTAVLTGITAEYATGRLSGKKQPELDILVEDEHAVAVVQAALSNELRNRVRLIPVGSHTAVMRHLAARATERAAIRTCVILDGDRAGESATSRANFLSGFELRTPSLDAARADWVRARICHLPGETWPERWVVDVLQHEASAVLDAEYGLEPGRRQALYEAAVTAGKHNEFYSLGLALSLPADPLRHRLISCSMAAHPSERARLSEFVSERLAEPFAWPA